MNTHRLTALLALVLASLACGQSNQPIGAATATPWILIQPVTPQSHTLYHVGDVIQLSDQTITLEEAQIVDGDLRAVFSMTNTGAKDINVSALVSFDARLTDGTQLEDKLFGCEGGRFDGKVLPGDRLRGSICWQGVSGRAVRIFYTPNIFGSGAVVWEVR